MAYIYATCTVILVLAINSNWFQIYKVTPLSLATRSYALLHTYIAICRLTLSLHVFFLSFSLPPFPPYFDLPPTPVVAEPNLHQGSEGARGV